MSRYAVLTRWVRRHRLSLFFAGVLLLTALFAGQPTARDNPHVTFFDVGQGDAVHIRARDGFDIVVDGGPHPGFARQLAADLPPRDRTLELVILSHPHADHLTGLVSLFDRFEVQAVATPGTQHDSRIFSRWAERLDRERPKRLTPAAGEVMRFPGGQLTVLWPTAGSAAEPSPDLDDHSLVVRVDLEGHCILLTGDLSSSIEKHLPGEKLPCETLKVGHHGSATSTSAAFLDRVRPQLAVISVGQRNRYGHPAPSVLQRLAATVPRILRTDEYGTIRLFFEKTGQFPLIKTEH